MTLSLLFIFLLPFAANANVILTEGTNLSVDVASDGRIVFDLLGGLWVLPQQGSKAQALDTGQLRVRSPRWSPNGGAVAFTAERNGISQVYLYELDNSTTRPLGSATASVPNIAWHPDGSRVVFSSSDSTADADLFEVDTETGLQWRLTSAAGDETDPAWSADGRDLIYIHHAEGRWSLMLRRFGEPARALIESEHRLSSPSWRPDGSLISYLKHDGQIRIHMLILSEPMLDRELVADSDIFDTPVAWKDRQTFVYAANGNVRRRDFNSWIPRNVPFRAEIAREPLSDSSSGKRELPMIDEPENEWVLRVERAYSATNRIHRQAVDIVIRGGRIAAVEATKDRGALPVIDLGDVTAVPGYIDAYSALPNSADESLGPMLLSLGITTMVTRHPQLDELNRIWSGEDMPGPRLLAMQSLGSFAVGDQPWLVAVDGSNDSAGLKAVRRLGATVLADSWQTFLNVGASLVLGSQSSPTSPAGRHYEDVELATQRGPFNYVSAMAGMNTPGIETVFGLRQADRLLKLGSQSARPTGIDRPPSAELVLGSLPNGLPPGLATIAELTAMSAAGRPGHEVLDAAGQNAARSLGLDGRIGSIEPGALADLVVLGGDPLVRDGALTSVVAVVRNGRFFSAVGLIDRVQ